jgi:hypothetical protein
MIKEEPLLVCVLRCGKGLLCLSLPRPSGAQMVTQGRKTLSIPLSSPAMDG